MSTKFLTWREKKLHGTKLTDRWIGPCTIKTVHKNNLSVELEFPHRQWKLHPIVPISRIKHFHADVSELRAHLRAPEPVLFEDEYAYEVEQIVDKRYYRRRVEYRVKFKGYDDSFNEWLPERELRETCQDMIDAYENS